MGCRRVKEKDGWYRRRGNESDDGRRRGKIHKGEEKGGLTGKMNSIRERR